MTLDRAQNITGLSISILHRRPWYDYLGVGEDITIAGTARSEKEALQEIVQQAYKKRCLQALDRDGWKCVRCGGCFGLQCHHKVYRSQDRSDLAEALESLCVKCHGKQHGINYID